MHIINIIVSVLKIAHEKICTLLLLLVDGCEGVGRCCAGEVGAAVCPRIGDAAERALC